MKKNSAVELRLNPISDKVKQDSKSLTGVRMGKKRDEYGNAVGGYEHIIGGTKTPKGERVIPRSYSAQRLFEVLFQYREEMGFDSPYLAYDGSDEAGREKALGNRLRKKELKFHGCYKSKIDNKIKII